MSTGIVNRIERCLDIEQRYSLPPDFHSPCLTKSDVADHGNLNKLAHSRTLLLLIILLFTSSGRDELEVPGLAAWGGRIVPVVTYVGGKR